MTTHESDSTPQILEQHTSSSAASPTTANLAKPALNKETSDSTAMGDVSIGSSATTAASESAVPHPPQEVTVNDTLKVIFVGMAMGTYE